MITVAGFQQDQAEQKRHRDAKAREREALTAAHAADAAAMEAECAGPGRCEDAPVPAEGASKSIPGIEADPGPGTFREPGMPGPEDFQRGYEHPGHAAPSPQSGPPCDFPVAEGQPTAEEFARGYLRQGHAAASPAVRDAGMPQHQLPAMPRVHGAGPAAEGIAAHMARYEMTSPSPRGGR